MIEERCIKCKLTEGACCCAWIDYAESKEVEEIYTRRGMDRTMNPDDVQGESIIKRKDEAKK